MANFSGGALPLGFVYASPGAVAPGEFPKVLLGGIVFRDLFDGGLGFIRGQVPGLTTFDGVPGPAKVYALDRKSMQIIRATRSGADGTYELATLRTDRKYLILGIDENDQDNAVVMDRVQAGIPP